MDNDPQYKTADGSALRIWRDSIQNRFCTEKCGRPIFDEVIYVEVISPGSSGSTPVFEVKRIFAAEMAHPDPLFGLQYEQYKTFITDFEKAEEADANLTGTPLKEWPEISRTMAASLRASSIFSVEALAALPDEKLSAVGPDGRTWREKANAWLAATKDAGYATALAAELDRVKADSAAKDELLKQLSDKVTALEAAQAADTGAATKPAKGKAAQDAATVLPEGQAAPDPLNGGQII